ncbi:MAG: NIL domain-containing protein [Chloroflexota bacterium]
MAKRRFKFTFLPELIREPVIYQLGLEFKVVTNILRANVEPDKGWVILQLEGKLTEVERACSWVRAKGVTVEPAEVGIPA